MAKYNVGDKVRIVGERGIGWNLDGLMDKWCNQIMTIRKVVDDGELYHMVEDSTENWNDGWLWSNEDIVERVDSVKPDNKPMPKLTTGMFGVMCDGERFVIVNDNVVYQQSGQVDEVEYITEHPELVKALYDSYCFGMVEDGVADVIWENPNPYVEDEEDNEDTAEDDTDDKAAKFVADFIARIEEILGEDK